MRADLLLRPLSAGGASRELVEDYEKILKVTPGAPQPDPPWSGDFRAFAGWARTNLPPFALAGAGRVICHGNEARCRGLADQ